MSALFAIHALAASAAPDPIVGTWEGTSLCQVRPSPCHDEHAVYHFTRSGPATYRGVMNKRVAGEEQAMGEMVLRFDERRGELTGTTTDRAGRPSRWTFTLHGSRFSGRLITADGRLYRLIEVARL
jgi:hypothetical protein